MSDLVGNPEDRFSHNEAHLVSVSVGTTTTKFSTTTSSTTKPVTKSLTTSDPSLPVDGGWSAWGPWQGCDTTCDRRRVRVRFCNNPVPSRGGASCVGLGFEAEKCNPTNCQTGKRLPLVLATHRIGGNRERSLIFRKSLTIQ